MSLNYLRVDFFFESRIYPISINQTEIPAVWYRVECGYRQIRGEKEYYLRVDTK